MSGVTLTEGDRQLAVGAIDTMASLLAEHGHNWTEGERAIYETAMTALGVPPAEQSTFEATAPDID